MGKSDFSFYNTRKYKLVLCLSVTFFFYFFLIYFLPFGVDNYNPNHQYTRTFLFEIFKFALAIFAFLTINEFVLRPFFMKRTVPKHIVYWSIWTLLLLSTVIFFLYNYLGNWHDYRLRSYLGFLVDCSAVLIFPLMGTFFFFKHQNLQSQIGHFLTTKVALSEADVLVNFKGQGNNDQITLALSSFLFGKAQNNYVELFYLEEGQLKKFLLRSSLRNLVDSVQVPAISRCHRSYMVNLLTVKAIKRGSQEMNLCLDPFDTSVPVSKSYRQRVIENLQDLNAFA